MMFGYYPFKMDIVKHYIQNYGDIVTGTKLSQDNSLSISCQLITSYKVIRQYALENKIGIGQKSAVPTSTSGLLNYYPTLFHDLSFIG